MLWGTFVWNHFLGCELFLSVALAIVLHCTPTFRSFQLGKVNRLPDKHIYVYIYTHASICYRCCRCSCRSKSGTKIRSDADKIPISPWNLYQKFGSSSGQVLGGVLQTLRAETNEAQRVFKKDIAVQVPKNIRWDDGWRFVNWRKTVWVLSVDSRWNV